jgi:hypothetical protein
MGTLDADSAGRGAGGDRKLNEAPGPPPSPISITRRDVLVLGGFFVFLLIFFSGILIMPGERCLGRPDSDARSQFYGWRAYGFGEIRAGRFPLWNPYEFLGMPFVASFQSAMFYPTNWLCAVLPLGRAINWGIILNFFLSGLFTYLWCRRAGLRWVGSAAAAAAYVFGAPQFLRVFEGHWSFLAAMPWIPCLLLCMEELAAGRWSWGVVAGGAGAVAMQLFAGQPQYVFFGGIAAVFYFAGRTWQEMRKRPREACKAIGSVALIYLLGALAAGVQLLPAIELLSISSRKGQLTYEWVSQFSLVPEALITLVAPDFFGSDLLGKYWGRWNLWETSAYVGVIALGLALFGALWGRRRTVLLTAFMIVLLFILALGENAPALQVLYRFVPGFGLFRAPARFLAPLSLFLAFLAGVGADLFVAGAADGAAEAEVERRLGRMRSVRAAWIFGVGALLLAAGGVFLLPHPSFSLELWPRFMRFIWRQGYGEAFYLHYRGGAPQFVTIALGEACSSVLRAAILMGALAILAWTMAKFRLKMLAVVAVLFLLLAADYWTFGRRYLATFDPAEDGLTMRCAAWLRDIPGPFRFARGGDLDFPPCDGMAHRFCCLEGIQPNVPARFRDAFWQLQGQPPAKQQTAYELTTITTAMGMLNLDYLVCYRHHPRTPMPGLHTVYEDDRVRVDALPNPWPRAWLVHRFAVVSDPMTVLGSLDRLDYENSVLLEENPGRRPEVPPRAEPFPTIEAYEPSRVVLKLEAASDALLVLSDLYYPGWRAEVDGRPADILRADYLLRAVAVPGGRHTVSFVYEPASFRAGIAATLAGALAAALMVSLHVRSRRGPLFRRSA